MTTAMSGHILVVDDDKAFRVATRTLLRDAGLEVSLANSGAEGLVLLEKASFDLVLSDIVMTDLGGIDFLREAKRRQPELPVIMVTGFGSVETAVEAMRLGAADYLTKPCNNKELLIKIDHALDGRRKDREIVQLKEELQGVYSFGNIVSRSEIMKDVIDQIKQVAETDVSILVRGGSGTGKELVARALHFNSGRRDAPFIPVNCSALPENLLESELFGYEKGAFTGAQKQRIGKFEEAYRGTIFLDEIGDIPQSVQVKLLRVLQEKSFSRIGGNEAVSVDARVVAATNRNLELMMRENDFREDLYYRLNVFPITLPSLRQRIEDLPLIAEHFLERYKELGGNVRKSLSPEVLSDMMMYSWPGNIRELQNLIKRAIIKTRGEVIERIELSAEQMEEQSSGPGLSADETVPPFREYLSGIVNNAEEKYIRLLLDTHKGNVNQVAKLMEVDRKTVYRKMADLKIDPDAYRS